MASDLDVCVTGQQSFDAEMQRLSDLLQEEIRVTANRLGQDWVISLSLIQDLLERGVIEPGPGLFT